MPGILLHKMSNAGAPSSLIQVRKALVIEHTGTSVTRGLTYNLNVGYHRIGLSPSPQQVWMLAESPEIHHSTQGKYDLVVWNARGNFGHPGPAPPGQAKCFDTEEEKKKFYARASEELGFVPAWDNQTGFLREQTYEDAKYWLRLQSMAVAECVQKQNTTMLSYMGTAATVRDLVAMADFFDGPNSAINYWGIRSGTRIGQYLLQMFPERARRVLLQAPEDLHAYLYQDSYEIWRQDVMQAQNMLGRFVEFCAQTKYQDCSAYWDEPVLESGDSLVWHQLSLFTGVRNTYMGWRNSREVDMNNSILESAFVEPVSIFTSHNASDLLYGLQHVGLLDDFSLGTMPLRCGDKAADYDPETAAQRAHEIAVMLEDDIHLAPLLSTSMFPPIEYLCHLWPVRAAERLSLLELSSDEVPKKPAIAPLVIQYNQNPFARRVLPFQNVLAGVQGAHEVVQMRFGTPVKFRPNTCLGKIIREYLLEGKLPDPGPDSECHGNAPLSADTDELFPDMMGLVPGPNALWDELWQVANSIIGFITAGAPAVVVVAVIAALAVLYLKRRGFRASVGLDTEETLVEAVKS
ncbi:hypothetical protein GY45DRAFT_1367746 [Cubamyces sp. BRFM 1775]|nr:hypothetical protein GY45DRAFT_1367746 [Cubamyces sp. BRFM 1775]